jgi:RNA polymerase sigma factor (sigma-70 family)
MAEAQPPNVLHHLRQLVAVRTASRWTDRDLLEYFVAHHDEAAFAILVERHGPMVLSVCRRVLRHVQDAEDACQATFLVLARKAASIRKHDSVASWLHGVAYRIARKAKAALTRQRVPLTLSVEVPQADTAGEATWREVQVVLDEELQRLPDKYRVPLVLCYLEGRTRDEAAQQLGWTPGTLRGRLERGRERLRERLRRRGLPLSAALLATLLAQHAAGTAVPASLVVVTVRAACAVAAGTATTTGLVSPAVAVLVEGGVRAMFVTKLKILAAVLLAVGVLGAGAGVLAYQKVIPEATKAEPATPPQPPGSREGVAAVAGQDPQPQAQQEHLQALRKVRMEAVELEVDVRTMEFMAGRGNLDQFLDAARRLLQAQRELSPDPAAQFRALEAYAQLVKEIYRTNHKRFTEGRIPLHTLKQTEFHYLEAELWLAQARAQKPGTSGDEKKLAGSPRPAEALDLKKFGRVIPEMAPIRWGPGMAPIRRRNLTQAQVDALRNQFEARFKEFLDGRGMVEPLLELLQQQVEAEVELHADQQARRIAAVERFYELTKRIEEVSKARSEAGQLSVRDYLAAKFRRVEAEFWLQEEKRGRL